MQLLVGMAVKILRGAFADSEGTVAEVNGANIKVATSMFGRARTVTVGEQDVRPLSDCPSMAEIEKAVSSATAMRLGVQLRIDAFWLTQSGRFTWIADGQNAAIFDGADAFYGADAALTPIGVANDELVRLLSSFQDHYQSIVAAVVAPKQEALAAVRRAFGALSDEERRDKWAAEETSWTESEPQKKAIRDAIERSHAEAWGLESVTLEHWQRADVLHRRAVDAAKQS